MDKLVPLLLRGGAGALLIAALGFASDRLPAAFGALLASIPTTTAVSLFFIAQDQGIPFAVAATSSSAFTQVANIAFAGTFAVLAWWLFPRKPVWAAVASIGAHALFTLPYFIIVGAAGAPLAVNLALYVLLLGAGLAVRRWILRQPNKEPSRSRPPLRSSLVQRILLGGGLVMGATVAADLLGPSFGGVFASFPVTFISLLLVAYRNRTLSYFLEQALGVIPNTLSLLTYILGVHFLYPRLGIAWGTAASYALFAAVAAPIGLWSLRQIRHGNERIAPAAEVQAAFEEPQ